MSLAMTRRRSVTLGRCLMSTGSALSSSKSLSTGSGGTHHLPTIPVRVKLKEER